MPACASCNVDVLESTLTRNDGLCAKCRRVVDVREQFPDAVLSALQHAAASPPGHLDTVEGPDDAEGWLVDLVIDVISGWRQPSTVSYERTVFCDGEYEYAPVVIFENALDYLYVSEDPSTGVVNVGKAAGDPPDDLVTPDVE